MTRAKRILLAGAGVLLVGIGALGVVLPGLPTTIFLLGASWCFVRSIPWLEEKLLKNRFFAPYLKLVEGDRPMPMRTRVTILAMIWVATSISMTVLRRRELLGAGVAVSLAAAALIGSIVVWRFRRGRATSE